MSLQPGYRQVIIDADRHAGFVIKTIPHNTSLSDRWQDNIKGSELLHWIQSGRINQNLAYILLLLLVALVYLNCG